MMQDQTIPSDAPAWLVDFLMTPPTWFVGALVLAAVGCLVVVARKLASEPLHITDGEHRQMLLIVGTAEGVALGVIVAMNAGLSYLPAVGVGLVGGFAVVEILRRCDPVCDALTLGSTDRIALSWAVIGGSAVVVPALADSGRAGRALSLGVGGLAAALFLWVVVEEATDGETLGEAIGQGVKDD